MHSVVEGQISSKHSTANDGTSARLSMSATVEPDGVGSPEAVPTRRETPCVITPADVLGHADNHLGTASR